MLEDNLYKFLDFYQLSPQPIKSVAGTIYRYLPNSIKYSSTYQKYSYLLNETEYWDKSRIQEFQWRKFKETIEHAYKNVPFYEQRWKKYGISPGDIKDFNDIERIPFTEKKDVRDSSELFISRNIHQNQILEISTGGSTGEPLPLYYHKGTVRSRELAFMEKQWNRIGYESGDRIAVLRSSLVRGLCQRKLWTFDPIKNRWLFSSFDITEENLPKIIEKIRQIKPKFLHVYPSALTILANYMKARNIKQFEDVKAILGGSENTFPWQIQLFKDVFRCKVFRWYGLAELSALAGSCEKSYYYHCFPEYSYVELIDEQGNRVNNEGQVGEIVGTSFDNTAMPLIRYRTGDFAQKGPVSCKCGRNHFLLGEIQGRKQEMIVAKDGSKIPLGPVIFGIHQKFWTAVSQVQFVQHEKGRLILRIKIVSQETDKGEIMDFIDEQIFFKLRPNFEVSVDFIQEFAKTPIGKHKYLISDLL